MIRFAPILEQSDAVQERVLEMRNQPSVRHAMYTDHVISWTEHQGWLYKLESDETKSVRVVFEDDKPIGVVVLEKINWLHKTCGWAFYLDESVRGRGIGLQVGRYAHRWAFEECGMEKVNGEALDFNGASLGVDAKLGMTVEGRIRSAYIKDGKRVDVVLIGITRAEWLAQQEKA